MSEVYVIYGGSFDPPTKAHAALLRELSARFSSVYVVPCKASPFKNGTGASAADRLAMLGMITEGLQNVGIDTFELDREGCDYTYITLGYFRERFPGIKPYLCIGSEMALELERWKRTDYMAENASQESMGLNPSIKKVGKAFNTFLIIEVDSDLFFIDQHAAHERLLYERFKAQYDNKNIVVQPLLFPYVLSLNPLESNVLFENIDTIRSLGFDIDEFGRNSFKVSAVPAIVSEMNFDSFFSGFLSESKNIAKKSSDLIRDYLMQHSCKSAIKGGNDLTESEINQLYKEMSKEKIALFCPHGRPIAIRINKTEIEKWFKRIV